MSDEASRADSPILDLFPRLAGADPDIVTTSELCRRMGFTPATFGNWRSVGRWKIEPLTPANAPRHVEATWSLSEALETYPFKKRPPIGEPPDEIERPDGRYVWIVKAVKHAADLPVIDSKKREGAPDAHTLADWIGVGCDLLPLDKDGNKQKLRGHTITYRLPGNQTPFTRRYVHADDFSRAIAIRRAGVEDRPGWVDTDRAREISGLGYHSFRRWVVDKRNCRWLIGRAAVPDTRPKTSGHCIKPERLWRKADMVAIARAINEKCAMYPGWLMQSDAKREYPKLPGTALRLFQQACKFLPDRRGINYRENVLRRDPDGSYNLRTVYDPADLARIEAENKLLVRDSRNRIVGRRPAPAAPAGRHEHLLPLIYERVVDTHESVGATREELKPAVDEAVMILNAIEAGMIARAGAKPNGNATEEPKLPERIQWLTDALREAGCRLTGEELAHKAMGEPTASSTFKTIVGTLVELGILTNKRDARGKGYGLPEWG